jgi:NRAMP (natural resistance-associated macrophage protein)-like metal ion transporter
MSITSTPSAPPQTKHVLAVIGTGLVVMLADTDAGSVITAAQSGAQWGYKLLLMQLILIPILYVVQELTVRLGLVTGKGHGQLIEQHFGVFWSWFSLATLLISCLGALLSELSGLAGVGSLLNIPQHITISIVVVALVVMALTRSYLTVERIALGIGAFELIFVVVAYMAQPNSTDLIKDTFTIPYSNKDYLYLVSANIGAVIMPWMVFFQQSSVVERKLTLDDLPIARADTAIGAVITQIIMVAVLIAAAATIGTAAGDHNLDTVQQISESLTPFIGEFAGKLLFGIGMTGAAMVATIVVTITAARTFGEVAHVNYGLDYKFSEAPLFYSVYIAILIGSALIVLSGINLVTLSIGVQVINSLLLPFVLGFLFLLAQRLPEPYRLKGGYALVSGVIIAITTIIGVYSGISGLMN